MTGSSEMRSQRSDSVLASAKVLRRAQLGEIVAGGF